MEHSLFNSSIDESDQSGVFVLCLPACDVNACEHIDRILDVLHRNSIRAIYQDFVSGLAPNQCVKFKAKVGTAAKEVSLKSSGEFGPHLSDHTKIILFSDVDSWDTNGQIPSLLELMQHFNLPSLSTVMPHAFLPSSVQNNIDVAAPLGSTVLGY